MAQKSTDVAKKAAELEGKLNGKLFLEGNRPSAADAKAFQELLGAGNLALFRWVKHMASFPESERKAWGAPVKAATAAAAKPAAKPAEKAKHADPNAAKPAGKPAAKAAAKPAAADDDDDLFGEETEEDKAAAAAAKEKKKANDEKKKKEAPIAKSTILLDIKPYDDETDLKVVADLIKKIEKDGLVWGASKVTEIAYGVMKLQQMLIIEDEKVSSEDIEDMFLIDEDILENEPEKATELQKMVQSIDIVAWNKL